MNTISNRTSKVLLSLMSLAVIAACSTAQPLPRWVQPDLTA